MPAVLKSFRARMESRLRSSVAAVWAGAALLLVGCMHSNQPNTSSDADWKELIPADLIPQPHQVPPSENAISNWLYAADHLVRLKEIEDSIAFSGFSHSLTKPEVSEPRRSLFRSHVANNSVALAAFAAGIEQGALNRNATTNRLGLGAIKSLSELRWAETKFLAEEGRWDEAGSRLVDDFRVPEMLSKDAHGTIDFLVAIALQSILNNQILSLAGDPHTPASVLRALGDRVDPSAYDRSDLVRAFRYDAYECLTNVESAALFFTAPTEAQSGLRNLALSDNLGDVLPGLLRDHELMRRHPKPFDPAKTISIQAKHFTETLNASENHSSSIDFEAFGQNAASKLTEDCERLVEAAKEMEPPLSSDQADRLAQFYRAIENPVGRLMMTFDPLQYIPKVEDRIERLQVTSRIARIALELSLFERQHGHWPESLEELPAVKSSPDIVADLYSDETFRYSAEAKRVWSVAAENSKPGAVPEARTNRVRGLFWPTLPD